MPCEEGYRETKEGRILVRRCRIAERLFGLKAVWIRASLCKGCDATLEDFPPKARKVGRLLALHRLSYRAESKDERAREAARLRTYCESDRQFRDDLVLAVRRGGLGADEALSIAEREGIELH